MLRRISPQAVPRVGNRGQTFRPGLRAIDEGKCHDQGRVQLGPVDGKDGGYVPGSVVPSTPKRLNRRPFEEGVLTRRVVGNVVDDGHFGHRLADHALDSLAKRHA